MPSYSGLYDGVYNTPHALLSDAIKIGNEQTMLARVLGRRPYGRAKLRELMVTLTGAAAGSTALASHKRVDAHAPSEGPSGGGVVPIETYESVNRATVADDVTDIVRALELPSRPTTYPTDRSGVGGGGKLGF